jgi:hypothetical protein
MLPQPVFKFKVSDKCAYVMKKSRKESLEKINKEDKYKYFIKITKLKCVNLLYATQLLS